MQWVIILGLLVSGIGFFRRKGLLTEKRLEKPELSPASATSPEKRVVKIPDWVWSSSAFAFFVVFFPILVRFQSERGRERSIKSKEEEREASAEPFRLRAEDKSDVERQNILIGFHSFFIYWHGSLTLLLKSDVWRESRLFIVEILRWKDN